MRPSRIGVQGEMIYVMERLAASEMREFRGHVSSPLVCVCCVFEFACIVLCCLGLDLGRPRRCAHNADRAHLVGCAIRLCPCVSMEHFSSVLVCVVVVVDSKISLPTKV